MTAKITKEEAEKRVSKYYNNSIYILEYSNIRSSILTKCVICGNIWLSPARDMVNGKGYCKICSPKIKGRTNFNEKEEREYVQNRNCEILGEFPNSKKIKVDTLYPCGHINSVSLSDLHKEFGCKQCLVESFYINRYSKEKLINICENNNLEFISFPNDYKDGSSVISYRCLEHHITNRMVKDFVKFPTCKQCKIIERGMNQRGENGNSWKGGVSKIWVAARARLDPWTNASLREADYKCCITGQSNVPLDVHHITSFETIAKEAIREFGITDENYYWNLYSYYGEEVLTRIVELNTEYGLGAVMRKDIHILYHKIYHHGNNTPEQFSEFQQRISSGEITIPE